jgi:hypothetical protein
MFLNNSTTFIIFISLSIMGTFYELFGSYIFGESGSSTTFSQVAISFSIISNTNTLFEPGRALSCIDGIRLIMAIWIVYVHGYLLVVYNQQAAKRYLSDFNFSLVNENQYLWLRNLHIIDTFFIIG